MFSLPAVKISDMNVLFRVVFFKVSQVKQLSE